MDLITIDIETFYDKDFSLSKLTTEEYIRDPQFEVIGLGVKVNDGETEWASGTPEQIERYLRKFNWGESAVLAHNTMFDGAILSWCFGIRARVWLDTLCMGRALHGVEVGGSLKALAERYGLGEKGTEVLNAKGKRRKDFTPEELDRYGDYCVNDVDLTHKLFRAMRTDFILRTGSDFPKQELRLIDLTLRMFIEPTLDLDLNLLEQHLYEVKQRKEELLESVGVDKKELMSNPKFADLLRDLGVKPPMKISPTTGKQTYAFAKSDEEFKALQEHEDHRVQALVAARLGTKSTLEETRTQRFIDIAKRGLLPVPVRYYAAHTGRWGGDDKINMQNLPSRGPNAKKLKSSIIAPPGYVLIDADSSQIEARVLSWLAGQKDLVQAFFNKDDVYKHMASRIYDKPVEEITKDERFVGKTTILGSGFGMGAVKFQAQLKTFGYDMDLDECRRIIDVYRRTNWRISQFWREAQAAIEALARGESFMFGVHGLLQAYGKESAIRLPSGLFMRYDDLKYTTDPKTGETGYTYKTRRGRTRLYGGKCLGATTEVLTNVGWKRIVDVRAGDKLWDGLEWCNHDGLIYQGEKPTLVLDGVSMTPDHEVLTEQGWRSASSCEGLHRAGFWLPDGSEVCGNKHATVAMGVPLRLREHYGTGGNRRGEVREAGRQPFLRVHDGAEKQNPRHVKAPSVRGVAEHGGSVQAAIASGMAQLWRSWHQGMRTLAGVVSELLGGYGRQLPARANLGSAGQRWPLLAGELPLGRLRYASRQPEGDAAGGPKESRQTDGYFTLNSGVSVESEPVYDIANAGPRSRFVVRGASGPFIVHNCVENVCQAVARCIIGEQMLRISKRYRVVLTVHDSIVCCVREEEVQEAQAYVEACMRWVPDWANGLPIDCESGVGRSYGECE